MTDELLSGDQIAQTGLDDWRSMYGALEARFATGDFATGLRFVAATARTTPTAAGRCRTLAVLRPEARSTWSYTVRSGPRTGRFTTRTTGRAAGSPNASASLALRVSRGR